MKPTPTPINDQTSANLPQPPTSNPDKEANYYKDWDAVNLVTDDVSSGFKFKPQYGRLDNMLTITMGDNKDVVIKLINKLTQKCIRYVYVKAGETYVIKRVPVGHYYLKAAFGQNWRQMVIGDTIMGRFTENAAYVKGDDDLYFYTDGKKVSVYSLRLDVTDGPNNLSSHGINEDEFNN